MTVAARDVSANFFSVLKIPLVEGRFFDKTADAAGGPSHAIVNQAWVRAYLHGESPVGKRIKFTYSPTQPFREIVGVVGDIADADLDSGAVPAIFLPFEQDPSSFISYVVRAENNEGAAIGTARSALREVDEQLPLILPLTMEQVMQQSQAVFLRRYPSYLIGSFAALAILLAMVGLYGLISYSVLQRTRELGIRMALGADRSDVLRLVMWQGTRLTAAGVAIGMLAALGFTRLMSSLLYGVKATDPATFGILAAALTVTALTACWVPARRATKVDPMTALRYE